MFNAQSGVRSDIGVFNKVYEVNDFGNDGLSWDIRTSVPLYGKPNDYGTGGDSVYYVMCPPPEEECALTVFNQIKGYWGGDFNDPGTDLGYVHPLRKLSDIALGFVRDFCDSHPSRPKLTVFGSDADRMTLVFAPEYKSELESIARDLVNYLDKNAIPKIVAECGLYQTDERIPEDDESISFRGNRYSFT